MRFSAPLALSLLLLLPLVAVLAWPRPGPARRRRMISLALRLALMLCMILALAGLEASLEADQLQVVFLLDWSDSMPAWAREAAVDYIDQALNARRPGDQAAVVVFAGDALVEQAMSELERLGSVTSLVDSSQTNLAAAIRLGTAIFSPSSATRMVVLSDGAATLGDASEAARLAAASRIELMALPFSHQPEAEILLRQMHVPGHLRQGEAFDLRLMLQSTVAAQADVLVYADDALVYSGRHALPPGAHALSLPMTASEPGFTRYRVQISGAGDTFYQNNVLATYARVLGPPQILVVAPPAGEPIGLERIPRPQEAALLVSSLRSADYVVEQVLPEQLPIGHVSELADYSAVVLVDVPARQLSQRQLDMLQSYVRDLGGGLVAVGGPTSYGVGGYFETTLEELLPVEMQLKDEQRRPRLGLIFVIDRSGSMSETSGGVTKLELAKEAAMRSVELLFPGDRVGVVAFDEDASWVVELTDVASTEELTAAIATLEPGGGTDILAGLQAVARVLPGDQANTKHVILLTDGGADPTGIPELVTELRNDHGISLTTIAVGRNAAPFLANLAALGGGRYHLAVDPGSIPNIFSEETALVSRSYIVEEQFSARQVNPSEMLRGIDAAPPLLGYVATTAKNSATTILVSHHDDPLLAEWQYGLGRSVAFTSDATGRWARHWLGWAGFPRFWTQVVRHTARQPTDSSVRLSVEPSSDRAKLVLEAQDEAGSFLNALAAEATLVGPDGANRQVSLLQTAPGRYEGEFTPWGIGAYLIQVTGAGQTADTVINTSTAWSYAYSNEYAPPISDPESLLQLVGNHGGRPAPEDPAEVFAHTLAARRSTRPIWPWLLAAAALLLPLDVGARRLMVTREDFGLARRWLRRRLSLSRPTPSPAGERPAHLGALAEAKERVRQAQPDIAERRVEAPDREERATKPAPPPSAAEPAVAEEQAPSRAVAEDALAKPEPQAGTTAARLLARKRRRQDAREEKGDSG